MKSKIYLPVLILLTFFSLFAQSEKGKMFAGTEDLLKQAKNVDAEFLSPSIFKKGMDFYNKAKLDLKEGKDVAVIYDELQTAETYFYKAVERSKINRDYFALSIKLRDSAEKINKGKYSSKYFEDANTHFLMAISLSEQEAEKYKIDREKSKAENLFEATVIIAKNEKVISPVIELKEKCKENYAELFSPSIFKKANTRLSDAFVFARAGNGEDFMKSIKAAEKLFKQAYGNSIKANHNNKSLITAYKHAVDVKAKEFAPSNWEKAKSVAVEGGTLNEKNNIAEANKKFTIASKLFWDAEKEAIYNKNIFLLQEKLDSLIDENAEKYTPIFTRRAKLLINKAKEHFIVNRYDKAISEYSGKASEMLTRIAMIVKLFKGNRVSVIDSLVLNNEYPFGDKRGNPYKVVKLSNPVIEQTVKEKKQKLNNIVKKDKSKSVVVQKKNKLKPIVKNTSKKIAEPKPKVEKLTPREIVAAKANSVFTPREATVIFEGNRVRLRLNGLKLAAYERTPSRKNRKLLKKLKRIIESTNKVKKVIIEVYSDSWGGDLLNRKLSAIRARTVKNYMIRLGVKPSLLQAKGIGNKNPIASNKTFEGRNKNRRVEVVFVF